MKKVLKLFSITIVLLLIAGCSKSITEITYKDLEKALDNKETFILEIVQDGCSNCEEFTPKFEKILSKYNIEVKQINLTKLTEEDNTKLTNLYNATGTPTVIFITEGNEELISRRIVGNVSQDKIISKLKVSGYIKE